MAQSKQRERVSQWVREFMVHLRALVDPSASAAAVEETCYRFKVEQIEPMLSLLSATTATADAAQLLSRIDQLLGRWAGRGTARSDSRAALRQIWKLAHQMYSNLTANADLREGVGIRLHDAPWRTFLDDSEEIVFDAGAGHLVSLRGDLNSLAWPAVIAQVAEGLPPYAESVRPYDVHGKPGGLINIAKARRLLVVGDLHGSFRNLETILKDKENLRFLKRDNTHLLFLGDAIHPRHSRSDPERAQADSFRVMFLILSLKAEIPDKVHYLIGNHENAHLGGLGAAKSTESEHHAFQAYVRDKFGEGVLAAYLRFLDDAPVAARFTASRGESILFVHGGPTPTVRGEDDLIDICIDGRRGLALSEVIWNRDFAQDRIASFLDAVQGRFLIVGHTRPALKSAPKYGFEVLADRAFGQAGPRMLLLCSQERTFGYLDIDLTQPLPANVGQLPAPDGKPALRVLVPRASA